MRFLAIGLALILPLAALSQATQQKPAATQKPATTTTPQKPATTATTPQKPAADATKTTTGVPQKTNTAASATADGKTGNVVEKKYDADGETDATVKEKGERKLEEVERGGGRPYREMLNEQENRSADETAHRHFSERELELRFLSTLLWEVSTTQKNDGKYRGARGVEVYLLTKEGVFLYDKNRHVLQIISSDKDMRSSILTPESRFAEKAPLILVYVSDAKKQAKLPVGKKDFYAGMDCGIANQAVSLFCASENMITTTIEIDPVVVGKILELKAGDKALLAQPVGFR